MLRTLGTRLATLGCLWAVGAAVPGEAGAQGGARASAPPGQDLTGTWVAVVTQYWHLRMTLPPKGEYTMLPLNDAATRVADAWQPADDADDACRAYGAAAIMRIPGRLRILWADDDTLQIDIDSGSQTRLLRFGAPADPGPPSLQGYSAAVWEAAPLWGRSVGADQPPPGAARYLRVTTTNMTPGYLRKNGVPYSAETILQEHFDTFTEPNGETWLVVTSIITDPAYLTRPYAVTNHFKRVPDGSGWDPTPCRVDRPR
ncbi:MAG: hypothetical protein OXF98_04810 [Rhodospirillaceae bacterium]|nr:hypothetical protein [Rhodospirillaceae bacterium]